METHPMAGKTVEIIAGAFKGNLYRVEDYWQVVSGGTSWMDSVGNPAALEYAARSGAERMPIDNEVLYGKIGAYGKLMHVSQLGAEVTKE